MGLWEELGCPNHNIRVFIISSLFSMCLAYLSKPRDNPKQNIKTHNHTDTKFNHRHYYSFVSALFALTWIIWYLTHTHNNCDMGFFWWILISLMVCLMFVQVFCVCFCMVNIWLFILGIAGFIVNTRKKKTGHSKLVTLPFFTFSHIVWVLLLWLIVVLNFGLLYFLL